MTQKKTAPFLTLPYKIERAPPPFETNEICYPASLARHFIGAYSKKGGKVFDPFVGLGTTLFTAEELGRKAYGIEAERQRFEWTAGQAKDWQHVFHADAASIPKLALPKMDLCLTSPPYMPADHDWNPLYSGDPKYAGYPRYLARMKKIFAGVQTIMKKGSFVVVQVDNLRHSRVYTPLVRDIGLAVSASFTPVDEIIVRWKNPPDDYPYTHCLMFKKV